MSDLIGSRRTCVLCDKEVEVKNVIPEGNDFRQILSCGHTLRYIERTLNENISITDSVRSIATDHGY
jgi:hypothetical protein